jgi:hypothetical protein
LGRCEIPLPHNPWVPGSSPGCPIFFSINSYKNKLIKDSMSKIIHPSNPTEAIEECYKVFILAMGLQSGYKQGLIDQKCITERIEIPKDWRNFKHKPKA